MKSYTNLEQSKKLLKILPLESADMHYVMIDTDNEIYSAGLSNYIGILPSLPCWSLTALLNVLPKCIKLSQDMRTCYKNPAYKGEKYYFNIEVCGLFDDRWFVYYCGKHERQLGKRCKQTYVNLLVSEEYENIIDACYEMVLKLHKSNLL